MNVTTKHSSTSRYQAITLAIIGPLLFLKNLYLILSVLIGLNYKLIILPYPDCHTTYKGRYVHHDASKISSMTKIKQFVDKVWVREGKESTTKISVSHNVLPIYFSYLEYTTALEACEGAVLLSEVFNHLT